MRGGASHAQVDGGGTVARRVRLLPWVLLLLAGSFMLVIWACSHLYLAHEYHEQLARGILGQRSSAHVLFANAYLHRRRGEDDKALTAYAAVTAQEIPQLRQAAYFNSGNLYLASATRLLEERGLSAWDEAGPLVALAKESYQKALRLQPGWPEAKYNYQLALRLAPSTYGMQGPQRYEDDNIRQDEDPTGWPAMPGNPRGMP